MVNYKNPNYWEKPSNQVTMKLQMPRRCASDPSQNEAFSSSGPDVTPPKCNLKTYIPRRKSA